MPFRLARFRARTSVLCAAIFVLLSWTGIASAAPIPFGPPRIVSVSDSKGVDVISGDLDGDGDLDLVASAGINSPSGVYWYENLDGHGSYSTSRVIDDCSGQLCNRTSIDLADMDGDGDLDLLTGWYYLCAWYPNDGHGHFGARVVVRDETFDGSSYDDFSAADIDGDGDLDVAAVAGALFGTNKIVWFPNNGGGSFDPGNDVFVANLVNEFDGTVVPADVDGDGDVDLVATQTASGNNRVVWFRNDFGGKFSSALTISTAVQNLGGIDVADVDGDGDPDVVSTDYGNGQARWHENSAGNGTAWSDHAVSTDAAGFFVHAVDMDLDGDADLLLATGVTNEAVWIENLAGNGTTWTRRVVTGGVIWPLGTIAADVDGDGDADVVTASLDDNKFAWNENRTIHRNARFDGGVNMDSSVSEVTEPRVADLDGDGDPDVVAALRSNGRLVWFDDDGTAPESWPLRDVATGIPSFTESSVVADLDGDGDLDVAISPGGGNLHWYRNNGGVPPTFTDQTLSSSLDPGIDVAAGDVDGDGDVDLIAQGYFAAAWYENDGSAPPNWTERPLPGSFANARDMLVVDLDRDGDLDVVVSDSTAPTLRWYENNGAPVPSWTQRSILAPADPLSVEAADMDGDGDIDLLTASASDPSVRWFENGGGAPLTWTQRTVVTGFVALSAFPADLDRDGDMDVLTGRFSATQTWYESNGGSPPQWTERSFPGFFTRQYNVIDLNGDRDVDVIGAAPNLSRVDAFENLGGQYGFSTTSATTGNAYNGEPSPLVAVGVELHGRPGDSVGRLDSIQLKLARNPGTPVLTSAEANALIDELRIYRDEGSGAFEAGQDYLVATVPTLSLSAAGVQTIALPPSDPNVRVAAPAQFFAVALMTANASSQSPNVFLATHLAVAGSSMSDANAGIALTGESTSDVVAGPITARPRFVVNSFADGVDASPGNGLCATSGGACTLRAAIQEANAHVGDDRIVLPAGTFTLSIAGINENAAATGDLDLTDTVGRLTLIGQGADTTILSGGGLDRVLELLSSTSLTLEDVTITGGSFGSSGAEGGGLLAHTSTSVTIRRCSFRGNALTGLATGGGALSANASSVVNIENSEFQGNTATIGASAIRNQGSMSLTNSTVAGNTAADPTSVAIDNFGPLNVASCTVTGNKGGMRSNGSTATLGSTIVAANPQPSLTGDDLVAGTFASAGYNFIGEVAAGVSFGGTGDQTGTAGAPLNPLLKPLGSYGGTTLTAPPQSGSPVVDKGNCPLYPTDQRGVRRPIDVAGVANVADGCDVGAYELEAGSTLARVDVPVRWCGLHGSPSIENPSLMGAANVNDLLRRRHEAATDNIWSPQTGIVFRSAASYNVQSYPLLEDPDCTQTSPGVYSCARGVRGDVYIAPDAANFDEYEELIAACRETWHALDPSIEGITAVQINHFIDAAGTPLSILGVGGRAQEGDVREQAEAGRVAVVDAFYRQAVPGNPNPPTPSDTIDRLLGHELGHAVSLRHGDGLDNDANALIDDDDEKAAGLPRFDGNNVMQYRSGSELTAGQATQARAHVQATIPDVRVQPPSDASPHGVPMDPKNAIILDFGFDGVLGLANARLLDFKNAIVLDFEQNGVANLANARLLDFKNATLLDFKNATVLDFGMSYDGETAGASARLHASTAAIPWPASVRPNTRYYFYLDLDRDDATGAYPASKVNPSDAPNHFPGSNNFVSSPTIAQEAGVDLIAEVSLVSTCSGNQCSSTSLLRIYDYNDGTGAYQQVSSTPSPSISATSVGLYVDNGGAPVDLDTAPSGITIQPTVPNSVLFAAGWGFTTPPGGGAPVPAPVRMEVVSTIDCAGNVLNDGSAASSRNCQCTSCAACPDYPGCIGTSGVPQTLSGTRILTDDKLGELTFQPPVLPECTVIPALAAQGQAVTVYVTQLPTNLSGTVEVTRAGTTIGTTPTSSISAAGSVSVAATLPSTALGQVVLSAGITGYAPRARCSLTVTPSVACADADADGTCDTGDTDDDNDGVADGSDAAPLNRLACRDVDADQCDDCSSGTSATALDGPDYDRDGLCDRGDPDDDNDGVLDASDGQPRNANACGDSDHDQCDDCVVTSSPSPGNDGPDAEGDGLCDFGDTDDDNDGESDWVDCSPLNGTLRASPSEVSGVAFGSGGIKNRLSWTAPQTQGGSATVSDVVRGSVLPVGSGAEVCLASGTGATQLDDTDAPATGSARWYLVRGRNACGTGSYGKTSAGVVRSSSACP